MLFHNACFSLCVVTVAETLCFFEKLHKEQLTKAAENSIIQR